MQQYRKEFNEGIQEGKWSFWKLFWPILGIIIAVSTIGYFLGWFTDAAKVAKDEFGPQASMKKYEWYIDQENRIATMDQTVANLRQKETDVVTQFERDYGKKSTWDLLTKSNYQKQIDLVREQLNATIAQRNTLAAEYNANSEKFNWAPYKGKSKIPREKFDELRP